MATVLGLSGAPGGARAEEPEATAEARIHRLIPVIEAYVASE